MYAFLTWQKYCFPFSPAYRQAGFFAKDCITLFWDEGSESQH